MPTASQSVAIIPARGGSKRLPRKNVLPLGGMPMISHPIRAAFGSGIFGRVIVSTDDDEIAEISGNAGAEIHRRPEHLGNDDATVVDVCVDVLRSLPDQGANVPWFACIYATAAFILASDLSQAWARLADDEKDAFEGVMSVSPFDYYPHSALQDTPDGLKPFFPDLVELSRHDVPELFASNGTFYMARTSSFLAKRTFYLDPLAPYVLERNRAVDIDTEDDYELAKIIYDWRQGRVPA